MSLTETTPTDFTTADPETDDDPSPDTDHDVDDPSRDDPPQKPAWSPQPNTSETDDENRCQSCGSFVTPEFTRVFGNNHNQVFGCLECMTGTEVKKGGARALDVDTTQGIVGGGLHGSI